MCVACNNLVPVEKTSLSITALRRTKTLFRDSKHWSRVSATPAASALEQTSHNESATSISDSTRSYIFVKKGLVSCHSLIYHDIFFLPLQVFHNDRQ